MNFSIAETIRRLLAPRHELSCSWFLWRRFAGLLTENAVAASPGKAGLFSLGAATVNMPVLTISSCTMILIHTALIPV